MTAGAAASRRICVFAGAGAGNDPAFAAMARELGATLADRGLGLVFGGEKVGLMGAVADGAAAAGGEVIGVIPDVLADIGTRHPAAEIRLVGTLGERKMLMSELSLGFIALPGGLGTLDELTEMLTWTQLGVHDKQVVLLDVLGAWTKLEELLDGMVANGFLRPEARALLRLETDPVAAVEALA